MKVSAGVGDVGPAVVEDQGVSAAFDLDVFGHFGVLELFLVAAVGECCANPQVSHDHRCRRR
jgi:hypothetical protein